MALLPVQRPDEMGGADPHQRKPAGADPLHAQRLPRAADPRPERHGYLRAGGESEQDRQWLLGGQHPAAGVL